MWRDARSQQAQPSIAMCKQGTTSTSACKSINITFMYDDAILLTLVKAYGGQKINGCRYSLHYSNPIHEFWKLYKITK
ncbi:hypothetical protein E2C01_009347 [Portunus trituberculatus]|uniref:Uncharacterized protein n=1 Tax=Portunus trituberculatus TaxID=210409 RepID=A0A5B7D4D7_PORTR|nr:hypothetical protein [Portunus trituberculatus]